MKVQFTAKRILMQRIDSIEKIGILKKTRSFWEM